MSTDQEGLVTSVRSRRGGRDSRKGSRRLRSINLGSVHRPHVAATTRILVGVVATLALPGDSPIGAGREIRLGRLEVIVELIVELLDELVPDGHECRRRIHD